MFARIKTYLGEVKGELQKASWPWDPKERTVYGKYKELIHSTVVVVIAMLLLSGYVAFWDLILLNIISAVTTGGGWF